ncbi:MAG TPA: YciI family protein [Burkholderiales bacterium]|nr:YciI family protein [Burkholderiales bacterium]
MYYFCRLIPPRPTFATEMNAVEANAMGEHVAYWNDLLSKGKVIAVGPVKDPKGMWGVAIVSLRDAAELDELQANDPAIKASIGMRYEAYEMPRLLHPK